LLEGLLELVKILRELSRRKKLVGLVLGVSLLIGFLLAFRPGAPPQSRQYQVALASSEILIDTKDSQVVTVGGKGPDLPTLVSRANLLGSLMTSGPLKDSIAKSAGIPSEKLVVVPPANASTPGVPPLPVETRASRGVPDAEAMILTLSIDESLPILHVVAQAPDEETAEKLSGGTIVGLRRYLGSVAASQDVPTARRLVVRQFGAPLAGTSTRGFSRRLALIVTIFLILLGCGAIVGGSWFVRSWKQIDEAESRGRPDDEEADEPAAENYQPTPLRPSGQAEPSPATGPIARYTQRAAALRRAPK
jgi:hypothetical protein